MFCFISKQTSLKPVPDSQSDDPDQHQYLQLNPATSHLCLTKQTFLPTETPRRCIAKTSVDFLLSSTVLYFLLPACLSRLGSCRIYGLSCYFVTLGSFITDPFLISTQICMLRWTPIRKATDLGEEMSFFFLLLVRKNNSFVFSIHG